MTPSGTRSPRTVTARMTGLRRPSGDLLVLQVLGQTPGDFLREQSTNNTRVTGILFHRTHLIKYCDRPSPRYAVQSLADGPNALISPLGTASVNETSRRDDFHSIRVPVLGSYYAEERRKVMKRFAAILATVGATAAVGAALAPVAFAAPGPNANCTAGEATGNHDISFYAKFPHPGGPSFVGDASSSDCGTR
jgi:hypothetical protein